MSKPLILLHPEALSLDHLVFKTAPKDTRAIFVWDDQWLQGLNYSLKRLVFIYETLCEMDVDIIQGETVLVINTLEAFEIYVPSSVNPLIIDKIEALRAYGNVKVIEPFPFVAHPIVANTTRFFQYWRQAEKSAFLANGGEDAERC